MKRMGRNIRLGMVMFEVNTKSKLNDSRGYFLSAEKHKVNHTNDGNLSLALNPQRLTSNPCILLRNTCERHGPVVYRAVSNYTISQSATVS